jgi:hypothetical protein
MRRREAGISAVALGMARAAVSFVPLVPLALALSLAPPAGAATTGSRPGLARLAAPSPLCPHLDTWNRQGVRGPNGVDALVVRFPAGLASQRGGSCTIMVEASYTRDRERTYSFMPGGQFLVNERFGRSPERDSAVSGTRAFFLFPTPRRLTLEKDLQSGHVVVRYFPVRVVEIDGRGLITRMTGAVLAQEPVITSVTQGGVTFKQFDGVLLDAGWGKGEVAFRKYPEADSTFTDRAGRTCVQPNRAIFDYSDRYTPKLAFPSDQALARFLAGRCSPEFDTAPLLAGPQRADRSVQDPAAAVPRPSPPPVPPGARRPGG